MPHCASEDWRTICGVGFLYSQFTDLKWQVNTFGWLYLTVSGLFGLLSLIFKVVLLNGLFTSDRRARDKIEVHYLSHRKYHKAPLFCAINR